MGKLFHLPLTIFWAPVCTGNSLSFELNAAGGLPEIFRGWELSLDTHWRVVRRKFKQRLHDQTQKRVQGTTGRSALLTSLSVHLVLERDLTGVRIKMNHAEFIPMDISYLPYPRKFMFCIAWLPSSSHGKAALKDMRVRAGCRSGCHS